MSHSGDGGQQLEEAAVQGEPRGSGIKSEDGAVGCKPQSKKEGMAPPSPAKDLFGGQGTNIDRSPFTSKGLLERINAISDFIDTDFNTKAARTETRRLCKIGQDLTIGAILSSPLITESVGQVVEELGFVIIDPIIWRDVRLINSLMRTYIVFIELTWYQWANDAPNDPNGWLLSDSEREAVAGSIQIVKKTISPVKRAKAELELRCIEEAIKLRPSETHPVHGYLKKLMSLINSVCADAEDWVERWKILRSEYDHFPEVGHWYVDFHSLRWCGSFVKSENDFKQFIAAEIDYFNRGGEYAEGLLIVFISIMKKEDNKGLRRLVFEGAEQPNLLAITNLGNIGGKFLQARRLAIGFLVRILQSKKPKYEAYHQKSLRALEQRQSTLDKLVVERKEVAHTEYTRLRLQCDRLDRDLAKLKLDSEDK